MVDQKWIPPEQQLARTFKSIDRRVEDLAKSTGTERNLTVQELTKLVDEQQDIIDQMLIIQAQQSDQLALQATLQAVGAQGSTGLQPVAGNSWATSNQPSVPFTTRTGRARVTISALLLATGTSGGATAIATAGIYTNLGAPVVDRDTLRSQWRALVNGVLGVIGGSYVLELSGLPVNTPLIARFECFADASTIQFGAPTISAAGAP